VTGVKRKGGRKAALLLRVQCLSSPIDNGRLYLPTANPIVAGARGRAMGIDYTNGWDVVIATSLAALNRKLLAIQTIVSIDPDPNSDAANPWPQIPVGNKVVTLRGIFITDGVQLVGGSGSTVQVRIGVGQYKGMEVSFDDTFYEIKGAYFLLDMTPSFNDGDQWDGDRHLMLKFSGPGAVKSVKLENAPAGMNNDEAAGLAATFVNIMAQKFPKGVEIASLPLSRYAGRFPWMRPIHGVDYAIHENALGILLATENEAPPGPPSLHDGVLASGWGCNAVMVINNQIFAEHFLSPMLAAMIETNPGRIYSMDSSYPQTVSIHTEVETNLGKVRVATATANDGQIAVHIEYDRSGGAGSGGMSYSCSTDLTYVLEPAGQTAQLRRTSARDSVHTNIPTWMSICSLGVVDLTMKITDYYGSEHDAAGQQPNDSLWDFAREQSWPFPENFNLTHVFLPGPVQFGGTV
jgi:hypothetical protein